MKSRLFLFVFIILSFFGFSANWDATYISKLLAKKEYDKIINYYKKEYTQKPEYAFKIADVYAKKKDYATAISWYQKEPHLLKETKVNLINLAKTYKEMGDYQKALDTYITYAAESGDATKVLKDAQLCEKLIRASSFTDNYLIEPYTFNTAVNEINLSILRANLIYLQRDFENEKKKNDSPNSVTLQAQRMFDKWNEPIKIIQQEETNKEYIKFSFTKDGNKVVFSAKPATLLPNKKESNKKPKLYDQIFVADFLGGQLFNIKSFPYNSEEYSCANPSFNNDGTKIIFSSDMSNKTDGFDIYESELIEGKWTKPKNLGNLLNSPKNDNHPFYLKEKNNKEYLYFSSDREDGFGGYDIYRAEYSDGLWQDVQLLPAPINTAGNEDSYTYDLETQTAYVSSDRSDSKGGFDIYRIKPLNLLLFITVKDNDTKDPLGFAFLELFEKNKKVTESVTNTDGVGKVNISPNKTYNVNVSKEGYRPQSLDFNTDKLKNEDSVVLSANLVKDPKFNIENSFSSVSTTNFILFTGNMTDASTGKIIKPEARITNLSNNKTKLIEYDETGNFNIKLLVNNNYKIIISNQGVKINDNITTLGLEKGSVKTKKYVLTGTKFKTTENSITSPALVSDAIKKLYFEDKQPTLATETLAVKQDTSKNNLVAANTLTPTINKPTELVKTEPLKDSIINKATETVSNTTNAKTEDVTVVTDENKNNTLIAEAISKITTTSKIIPFELGTELDPSKEKPTLTNAGNTYYKIQIGSYRDANANVDKLRSLDKIEEKFAYGQYFYRMGNYTSTEDAFKMLKNVKDEGYYLAFILQYKDDYIVKVIK